MGTKGNPPALLVGKEIGTATTENSMEVLQKLKIEETYEPSIPLLAQRKEEKIIYPKKVIIQKDTCTPIFTVALFTIGGTWKQSKRPSTEK